MELRVNRDDAGKASVRALATHSSEGGFTMSDSVYGFRITRYLELSHVSEKDIAAIEAGDPEVEARLVQKLEPGRIRFIGCVASFPIDKNVSLTTNWIQEVAPYASVEATVPN